MSESDWWLCEACHSLNNLSARRCYSCRARRPKHPRRASEQLNYRAVVSWDGKVRIEPMAAMPPASQPVARLRDPPARSTLAVAPRPPHGTRISHRLEDPERDRRLQPGMPVGPPRRRSFVLPVDPLIPARVPGRLVAVPIEPDPYADAAWTWPAADDRPYWQRLFDDLPLPHPSRLRRAVAPPAPGAVPRVVGALSSRGLLARISRRHAATALRPGAPAAPWPERDLAAGMRRRPRE